MKWYFKQDGLTRFMLLLPVMFVLGTILFYEVYWIIKMSCLLVMMICLFLLFASILDKEVTEQNKIINKVNSYADSKVFDYGLVSYDRLKGVLISKDQKIITTYQLTDNDVLDIDYHFSDLIKVELITDKNSAISVSTTGTAVRSAVGGALFGMGGAVIGATTANKNINENIKQLSLLFTFDDIDLPIYELILNKFDLPLDINSPGMKTIMEEVNLWLKRFEVIIHRNEKENNIS
ncbi:hypothetical protein [Rummeliibacillus stabekisii]|uniref:hypothetical protein n=1 Tax=Rummeliibacillus stabekisii TaxID=241244 RepID=UPI003722A640